MSLFLNPFFTHTPPFFLVTFPCKKTLTEILMLPLRSMEVKKWVKSLAIYNVAIEHDMIKCFLSEFVIQSQNYYESQTLPLSIRMK